MKAHSLKQLSMQVDRDAPTPMMLSQMHIQAFVNEQPVWHVSMLRASPVFNGVHWSENPYNNPAILTTLRAMLVTYLMDFQSRGARRCPTLAHMPVNAYGDVHHIFQEMNVMNGICNRHADDWALRNPMANDDDKAVFKNIHAELDIDRMDSYIHLSHGAFASKHMDILLWDKNDEETDMPLLHLQVFPNQWHGRPDIDIRINHDRQFDGMDMWNAIPKHGYIRSGTARNTESCELDALFRLHRIHAYGYNEDDEDNEDDDDDSQGMDEDDEDNEDDDDDSQGMDGGGANCAE